MCVYATKFSSSQIEIFAGKPCVQIFHKFNNAKYKRHCTQQHINLFSYLRRLVKLFTHDSHTFCHRHSFVRISLFLVCYTCICNISNKIYRANKRTQERDESEVAKSSRTVYSFDSILADYPAGLCLNGFTSECNANVFQLLANNRYLGVYTNLIRTNAYSSTHTHTHTHTHIIFSIRFLHSSYTLSEYFANISV